MRSEDPLIQLFRPFVMRWKNTFNTHFGENSRIYSVPIELLSLISVLIDGADISNKTFSQSAVACSQQIMYNFHKNKRKKSVQSKDIADRILQQYERDKVFLLEMLQELFLYFHC